MREDGGRRCWQVLGSAASGRERAWEPKRGNSGGGSRRHTGGSPSGQGSSLEPGRVLNQDDPSDSATSSPTSQRRTPRARWRQLRATRGKAACALSVERGRAGGWRAVATSTSWAASRHGRPARRLIPSRPDGPLQLARQGAARRSHSVCPRLLAGSGREEGDAAREGRSGACRAGRPDKHGRSPAGRLLPVLRRPPSSLLPLLSLGRLQAACPPPHALLSTLQAMSNERQLPDCRWPA